LYRRTDNYAVFRHILEGISAAKANKLAVRAHPQSKVLTFPQWVWDAVSSGKNSLGTRGNLRFQSWSEERTHFVLTPVFKYQTQWFYTFH
jgi:hypothetical protein